MAQNLHLTYVVPNTLPESAWEISHIWNQNIRFTKGEKTLVTAPSGKGKSSFVALLLGLHRDYKGSYKVNEEDTRTYSTTEWSALRATQISAMFQDLRLFGDITAWENLELKSRLNYPSFDRNGAFAMAEALGVETLLDKKCRQLSFGERQRIALIRSLLQPFDFLILDEPFSHLDENNTILGFQLVENEVIKNDAGLIITSLGSDYGGNFNRMLML